MNRPGRGRSGSPIDGATRRPDDVPVPSERSFGRVFTVVFTIVGGYQIHVGSLEFGGPLLAAACAIALVTWWRPTLLATPNRIWFRFGLLLNRIVTPVVMFLVYAIAFVPTGLAMRALGYDPLRRTWDPAADSYWIERSPPGPHPDSMRNQF